jgi:hypothetical protein
MVSQALILLLQLLLQLLVVLELGLAVQVVLAVLEVVLLTMQLVVQEQQIKALQAQELQEMLAVVVVRVKLETLTEAHSVGTVYRQILLEVWYSEAEAELVLLEALSLEMAVEEPLP